METPIKTVRLTQTAEEQLNKLKRITKISNWNILCRWALCRSLAETTIPSPVSLKTDSKIEIAWDTFGGEIADILLIALKQRCYQDGLNLDRDTLKNQFTLHLHRGLSYLVGDERLDGIEKLVERGGSRE
jgi:DNA sulfur modification protein DndE